MKRLFFFGAVLLAAALIFNAAENPPQCRMIFKKGGDYPEINLKHNYIILLDRSGKIKSELIEANGWLLLEGVLRKALGADIDSDFENAISLWNNQDFFGWWPGDAMQYGKRYFANKDPVRLYYDSDDTAWGHRYYNKTVSEDIVRRFLSEQSLPPLFDEACLNLGCDRRYLVRVWSGVDWHDDIDLVAVSNFITAMDHNSLLSKKVFEENKNMINFVIENREITDYFKYYEPPATGYFLFLFYDHQGPKFLSEKSKNILLNKLRNDFSELNLSPLGANWGGGADWFYGCLIRTLNTNVPKLMRQYAERHWNIN